MKEAQTIGLLCFMDEASTEHYVGGFSFFHKHYYANDGMLKVAMQAPDDFKQITSLMKENRWDDITDELVKGGKAAKKHGADFIVIVTTAMHKTADAVTEHTGLPVLHIADTAIQGMREMETNKAIILASKPLMKDNFLNDRFKDAGITLKSPVGEDICRLEYIRKAAHDGNLSEADTRKFYHILSLYDTSSLLILCSKFNKLLKPNAHEHRDFWENSKHCVGGKSIYAQSAANGHIRAAVKKAFEK